MRTYTALVERDPARAHDLNSAAPDDTRTAISPDLRASVLAHLRTITPDGYLELVRAHAKAVSALAARDTRSRRAAWGLLTLFVVAAAFTAAALARDLSRVLPEHDRQICAGVGGVLGAAIVGCILWLTFFRRSDAERADEPWPPTRAAWAMVFTALLYQATVALSASVFASLRGKYGGAPSLPSSALPAYTVFAAAAVVGVTALISTVGLTSGMLLADYDTARRRRAFARVLAAREFRQVAALVDAPAPARLALPASDATAALARAARYVEREFDAAVRGVPDPLTRAVRHFGYTVGDSVRELAVPVLTAAPETRQALAERLAVWEAAVIAGAWDRIIDSGVARRSTRLWPQWLREGSVRLRWVTFAVTAGGVGLFVWRVLQGARTTLPQALPAIGSLLGSLIALAVGLKLFEHRGD